MKKLFLALLAVLFLASCVVISPKYTGVRYQPSPQVYYGGYSMWNPMWGYIYYNNCYRMYNNYRAFGRIIYDDYIPRTQPNKRTVISTEQIRQRPQAVTYKAPTRVTTRSTPTKTRVTGNVVKKKEK